MYYFTSTTTSNTAITSWRLRRSWFVLEVSTSNWFDLEWTTTVVGSWLGSAKCKSVCGNSLSLQYLSGKSLNPQYVSVRLVGQYPSLRLEPTCYTWYCTKIVNFRFISLCFCQQTIQDYEFPKLYDYQDSSNRKKWVFN